MEKVDLKYYKQGCALCNYCSNKVANDFLSSLIRDIKKGGDFYTNPYLQSIIKGWSNWLSKSLLDSKWGIDIVLKVLGHDELELRQNDPVSAISRNVAEVIEAEYKQELITKVRVTAPQRNDDVIPEVERRFKNISNTFTTTDDYKRIKHKTILVIDDVVTSGATLEELGQLLCKEGNNELYFSTLAVAKPIPTIILI